MASASALGRRLWSYSQKSGAFASEPAFPDAGHYLGRFALGGGLKGIIGIGYQFAVMPSPAVLTPALTPTYNHAWLMTSRVAF
ncbi:MAG: hypothetical protein ACLQL2_11950 [Methylovirgula sp.]